MSLISLQRRFSNVALAANTLRKLSLPFSRTLVFTSMTEDSSWVGQEPLAIDDPEIDTLIKDERKRQKSSLELIASENFVSRSVLEALGSCLTNKYSDGYPGQRYYPGNEIIDRMERLCQKRALELFDLDPERWGVNVQPYAGSPANFAVFIGLLEPHDRLMGLDARDGGHSTHGTFDRNESATSRFFETMPYKLDPKTDLIDYNMLAYTAQSFRPKLIVAGTSAYTRLLDYQRLRQICDDVGAILMGDMAHISGLVAAKLLPTPFQYCDVVTTTTHKTLRGPRAGMIFYRKGPRDSDKGLYYDFEDKINWGVFPMFQGGPHNNTIAGLAVALKQAKSVKFQRYQQQVLKNAQILAKGLASKGYKVVTGGTDHHMVIVDLRALDIDGQRVEMLCDMAAINLNAISCPRELSGQPPTGIRVGSPALTSRQLAESDFEKVVEFIDRAVKIAAKVHKNSGSSLEAFQTTMKGNSDFQQEINMLRNDVESFISNFPMAGYGDI